MFFFTVQRFASLKDLCRLFKLCKNSSLINLTTLFSNTEILIVGSTLFAHCMDKFTFKLRAYRQDHIVLLDLAVYCCGKI